jgi:glycosyltransferase involved in cell wall biosynthesis
MKVLLLTSSLTSGGAERVASTLANAWSSHGHQVSLMPTFSGRGECFYDLQRSVRVVYLADIAGMSGKGLLSRVARLVSLRRFIKDIEPDIVVSFLSNVNVAAVLATLNVSVPLLISERIDPFVMPISAMSRLARRILYPLANALVVQTKAVAKKYEASLWPWGKVIVIPNAVPDYFAALRRNGTSAHEKRLLAVGSLVERKQFATLIDVFAKLAESNPDWVLQILGEGPLRHRLQKQIDDLGLRERITLPGRTRDIGSYYAKSDAFVLTSQYEGFPNALLEAMAVGLPCVAFDCPSGPREMSLDGTIAMLVPHDDRKALIEALQQVMQNKQLREQLGTAARDSVIARFSLHSVLRQWEALFEEVGANRRVDIRSSES